MSQESLREMVLAFHKKFDHPIGEYPKVPADDRVRFRARFMLEECFEFLEACGFVMRHLLRLLEEIIDQAPVKVDLPAAVDALLDSQYVNEGTLIEFGVDSAPVLAEIHRANMTKGTEKRADGKTLKPPGWTPPDIAGELERQVTVSKLTGEPKLVRDRVPERIRAAGEVPFVRVASPEEMVGLLKAKILEEAEELLRAPPGSCGRTGGRAGVGSGTLRPVGSRTGFQRPGRKVPDTRRL
jgi:predicted HAD superfamily Cof-like phosphohydrolase